MDELELIQVERRDHIHHNRDIHFTAGQFNASTHRSHRYSLQRDATFI